MLEAGMPVDSRGVGGWTALMYAAEFNNTDVVHLLMQKGADPNKQKDDGLSALHPAAAGL